MSLRRIPSLGVTPAHVASRHDRTRRHNRSRHGGSRLDAKSEHHASTQPKTALGVRTNHHFLGVIPRHCSALPLTSRRHHTDKPEQVTPHLGATARRDNSLHGSSAQCSASLRFGALHATPHLGVTAPHFTAHQDTSAQVSASHRPELGAMPRHGTTSPRHYMPRRHCTPARCATTHYSAPAHATRPHLGAPQTSARRHARSLDDATRLGATSRRHTSAPRHDTSHAPITLTILSGRSRSPSALSPALREMDRGA